MASGESVLSGFSAGSGRAAERTPPSMMKWATWIPLGPSSRAALWARPRSANLPMAKAAEWAKPFTLAVAPVSRIAPRRVGNHALGGLLGDEKAAEGADRDRFLHRRRIELRQRALGAKAGVVDDDVGLADRFRCALEEALDGFRIGRVGGECRRPGFGDERPEFFDISRRETDADAERGQGASQRRADAAPHSDDEGGAIGKL